MFTLYHVYEEYVTLCLKVNTHPAHPCPPARLTAPGGVWFGALRVAPWLTNLESQTCRTRKCPREGSDHLV